MKILILVKRHVFHLFDVILVGCNNHICDNDEKGEKYQQRNNRKYFYSCNLLQYLGDDLHD